MNYKVWVATNAFIYLPVYALKRYGILQQAAKFRKRGEVNIIISPPCGGDASCVQEMLKAAESDSETIHISVGDPLGGFEADPEGQSLRMVGGFIKRPSFWLIGQNPIPNAAPDSHTLVTYNGNFATGHFFARSLKKEMKKAEIYEEHDLYRDFGEEVDCLFDPKIEDIQGRIRVLTADILGMELARIANDKITIQKNLAKSGDYKHFITTAAYTHKKYLRKDQIEDVYAFVEALRTSCLLLHISPISTQNIISEISKDFDFRDQYKISPLKRVDGTTHLVDNESAKVARRIFDDDLYQGGVDISVREWDGLISARTMDRADRKRAWKFYKRVYVDWMSMKKMSNWLQEFLGDYRIFLGDFFLLKRATTLLIILMLFLSILSVIVSIRIDEIVGGDGASPLIRSISTVFSFVANAGLFVASLYHLRRGASWIRRKMGIFRLDTEKKINVSLSLAMAISTFLVWAGWNLAASHELSVGELLLHMPTLAIGVFGAIYFGVRSG